MAHITALLGSLSHFFSTSPAAVSTTLPHSKSDPDLDQHLDTHRRPASSTSVRTRPTSAMEIDGCWGWDVEGQGMTLRRRTRRERDPGLKAQATVKITDASPVLCQSSRPARTGTALPIACVLADAAAAAADLVNAPASTPTAVPYTLDRGANSGPDLSFGLFLDASLDSSLISDTSASTAHDSEGDISFTLPPPPAFLPAYADSEPDSALDLSQSFDISLISDTSTSTDESCDISSSSFTFAFPPLFSPSSPLTTSTSGAPLKPIGLGIQGLFKPSGAPFDGLGVLSFGFRGSSSPSPCRTRKQAPIQDTGLSRTFLEELDATWAADPQHHLLTVIHEEWDEGEFPYALDWAGEDGGESGGKTSRTRTRGVERDTISSRLKRKPASLVSGAGARPHRVWRA
ncbi:hypothetical protein C8R47DRAFT_112282 [Mycena vitilis]|nr:hypothetical protein C8R47DRAFT_112282 [Mycena vitilis]